MPTSLGNTRFAVCIKSKSGGLNQRFPNGAIDVGVDLRRPSGHDTAAKIIPAACGPKVEAGAVVDAAAVRDVRLVMVALKGPPRACVEIGVGNQVCSACGVDIHVVD